MDIQAFIPVTNYKPDIPAKYQIYIFKKQLLSAKQIFG